jgi:hypothetical protein
LLTYSTHLPKDEYIDWFNRTIKETIFLKIAHESGDEKNPYLHSHILIDFGKAFNSRNSRVFDFKYGKLIQAIHPHIQCVNYRNHFQRCLKYICKEDVDCQNDPEIKALTKKTFVELISTANGLLDIMSMSTKPTDYPPLKMMYHDYQDMKIIPHQVKKFRIWQENFIAELIQHKQNDFVIWIYDKTGGGGKTELARYLCTNNPDLYVCLKNCGGSGHFGNTVLNLLRNGWKGHCMILDLPRSAEQYSIYDPIEMFKDGCISTTKYQGASKWLPFKPNIVVFANFYPDKGKISSYKWDVRELKRVSDVYNEWDYEKIDYEDIPDNNKEQEIFYKSALNKKYIDFGQVPKGSDA